MKKLVTYNSQVALNKTDRLSLNKQIQMMLFASFVLLDKENKFKKVCNDIIHTCYNLL